MDSRLLLPAAIAGGKVDGDSMPKEHFAIAGEPEGMFGSCKRWPQKIEMGRGRGQVE